jgi:aminoglycoside 6'-N-acetyltransferase
MNPSGAHRYTFRPVVAADLPVLGAWLDEPHVAAWWDDVDDKLAEIRDAMTDPATQPFVIEGLFREGAPRVIVDPDPANGRAIRAYEKAGFTHFDSRTTIYGSAVMMARNATDR